jgi:predicted metal-dependent enzyme (double-stranded beta helix superfamily)
MFDRERFVDDCLRADGQDEIVEILARTVSDPAAVLKGMGEPTAAGLDVLHRSASLTIFGALWTPRMNLMPHDHRMWAAIGIYTGREDNILWKRARSGRIGAVGARALFEGDVAALPADAIHSVTNPLLRFTGGLHIYGGDFFATDRSQWDAETLEEEHSDGEVIRAMFEAENARLQA